VRFWLAGGIGPKDSSVSCHYHPDSGHLPAEATVVGRKLSITKTSLVVEREMKTIRSPSGWTRKWPRIFRAQSFRGSPLAVNRMSSAV